MRQSETAADPPDDQRLVPPDQREGEFPRLSEAYSHPSLSFAPSKKRRSTGNFDHPPIEPSRPSSPNLRPASPKLSFRDLLSKNRSHVTIPSAEEGADSMESGITVVMNGRPGPWMIASKRTRQYTRAPQNRAGPSKHNGSVGSGSRFDTLLEEDEGDPETNIPAAPNGDLVFTARAGEQAKGLGPKVWKPKSLSRGPKPTHTATKVARDDNLLGSETTLSKPQGRPEAVGRSSGLSRESTVNRGKSVAQDGCFMIPAVSDLDPTKHQAVTFVTSQPVERDMVEVSHSSIVVPPSLQEDPPDASQSLSDASETSKVGDDVECGSIYETSTSLGVTHLLGRMAFKSTTDKSHLDIVREVEKIDGHLGSSASREHMSYSCDALAKYVPEMINKLKDEISDFSRNPENLLIEAVHATGYSDPFANTFVASKSSLRGLNSSVLKEFLDLTDFALAFELPGGGWIKEKNAMTLTVLQLLMGRGGGSFSAGDPGKGSENRSLIQESDFATNAIDIAVKELIAVASLGEGSQLDATAHFRRRAAQPTGSHLKHHRAQSSPPPSSRSHHHGHSSPSLHHPDATCTFLSRAFSGDQSSACRCSTTHPQARPWAAPVAGKVEPRHRCCTHVRSSILPVKSHRLRRARDHSHPRRKAQSRPVHPAAALSPVRLELFLAKNCDQLSFYARVRVASLDSRADQPVFSSTRRPTSTLETPHSDPHHLQQTSLRSE
ncbi:Probable mitochondrial-processing peptidase subunit alpha-1 [Striga hermonthica]|uniref:Probable mitochondrial-processing peptidase subunit alpha-1 n=1 Tax=Striga hermonthica TaxID=68872 RepID=A0A9N7MNI0_STRHE|nr:Probable mitochondrial-processing peptidase subunit alpha-1 [Striga hermonthica]